MPATTGQQRASAAQSAALTPHAEYKLIRFASQPIAVRRLIGASTDFKEPVVKEP
jgi:hypothetical protein